MDTNLKTSNKIRAFLYRLVAFGAFVTCVATLFLGREAFHNLYREGTNTLRGEIYYLTEFRQYMNELYSKALLSYAGIGDENGYPIASYGAKIAAKNARSTFTYQIEQAGTDLSYYVELPKSGPIYHNIDFPLFSEYDNHLLLSDNITLCCYWNGPEDQNSFFGETFTGIASLSTRYYKNTYFPNKENAANIRFLIILNNTDDYQSYYFDNLSQTAVSYARILRTFFVSAGLWIIFFPCCLFSRKAGYEAKQIYTSFSSKIWFEVKIGLVLIMLFICYQLHLWHFNGVWYYRRMAVDYIYLYAPTAMLLCLFFWDVCQNRFGSLGNSLAAMFIQYVREFAAGLPWKRKAMFLHLGTSLASLILLGIGTMFLIVSVTRNPYYFHWILRYSGFLGILLLVLGIALLLISLLLRKFISDIAAVSTKLSELQQGTLREPLQLSKHSLLTQTAEHLNTVEDGMEAAVAESNRSSKMRVELITNVSHDLKTPLTSIINYADLLCEENLPAPASSYAESLRDKAYRLKKMVQDVFELSKATSGNLPVELVQLDLAKLIRQTLADIDEKIQENNITFKLKIKEEPLMIEADGDKLYRVFQNLFINALQYSLENSRVHVLVIKEGAFASVKVKNISRQELDFDPEEIVERFVRADTSRTTEGSGLGLSIAQSFTEACGGTFRIETDADMFTAHVKFPLLQ